jgi:hypothetical protein
MEFIDDKGRLFGKINMVDLFVILIIIVLIIVCVKFVIYKSTPVQKETITLYVYAYSENIMPEVAESVKVGEKEIENGNCVVEILEKKVKDYQWNEHKNLFLTLKIKAEKEEDFFYFKNRLIGVGKRIAINTEDHYLYLEVLKVYDEYEKINESGYELNNEKILGSN